MFLYIVRHGHPVYAPKEQLTDIGHRQARALVPRMIRAGITRIYSSPLRRAIENHLESPLAETLLSGELGASPKLVLGSCDGTKLVFTASRKKRASRAE